MGDTFIKASFGELKASYAKLSDDYLIIESPDQVFHLDERKLLDALEKLVEWLKMQRKS